MGKIEFPKRLQELLEGSGLFAPILGFADCVAAILLDNKLPFFPDYTDHGADHVQAVLKSQVELIPDAVWEHSRKDSHPRLLTDADAVVIIGATLLHDLAMHLRPDGFLQLVSKESRFKPLRWFDQDHQCHRADRPWHDLWHDYVREARRFGDRDLTNLIGEASARGWKFRELPADKGQWETNHFLFVGEFIRRNHARLAHEIAMYGFPGLDTGSGEGQFPALGADSHSLSHLADLIGLVARSHGTSLRVCKAYLDDEPLYKDRPRPLGVAALYPMALLRIADYLQIDRKRAPNVLLQLRSPQSPISLREWAKHDAVIHVGDHKDPRAVMVTIGHRISLPLYLQLQELLAGLQAEMDISTAVLDEAYGTPEKPNPLNLRIRRAHSTLEFPEFRNRLPYVPSRTGFTTDPHLLTLLVEPLYGKEPTVGVRELMQNAVDAVRELETWCKTHGKDIASLDLPKQEADVLIEYIQRPDKSWFLRVCDRGIGMTADTIQNYFLRAGASFRRSKEWADEFLDEQNRPRVLRAGRFGIGAFAIFLLGEKFQVKTRHAGSGMSEGYAFEASAQSQLIEIHRVPDLPIGTTVEVELSEEAIAECEASWAKKDRASWKPSTDWFCWDWPKVVQRVRHKASTLLKQAFVAPVRKKTLPPEWSVIHPPGFEAVYWTFGDAPPLSCNGLRIGQPPHIEYDTIDEELYWRQFVDLDLPCLAVVDSAAELPLTVQRYELRDAAIPFAEDLARDVILSFIAHSLVCGASQWRDLLFQQHGYPLRRAGASAHPFNNSSLFASAQLRWCTTFEHMVPADPYLYSLLDTESCVLFGVFDDKLHQGVATNRPSLEGALKAVAGEGRYAFLPWYDYRDRATNGFDKIVVQRGLTALHQAVDASEACLSAPRGYAYHFGPNARGDLERNWISLRNGLGCERVALGSVVAALEDSFSSSHMSFACDFRTKRMARAPETLLAAFWTECLGARPIPFDPEARAAMLADATKHPELDRHIKRWQEMKRKGSKWAKSHPLW